MNIHSMSDLALDPNSLNKLKTVRQDDPEGVKQVARQFESVLVNQMLKSMRDATNTDGSFDGQDTKTYIAMMDQQVAQDVTKKGIGLAEIMVRQLSKNKSAKPEVAESTRLNFIPKLEPKGKESAIFYMPSHMRGKKVYTPVETVKVEPSITKPVRKVAQKIMTFLDQVGEYAKRAAAATGIPDKFMIAQAALETGWGKKRIIGKDGTDSHNIFGIKATSGWKGKVVEVPTTEYINGVKQRRIEKFRAYDNMEDAFKDYARMITSNPRYAKAMDKTGDERQFAREIQKAGYATDPQYASKIIGVIKSVSRAEASRTWS